MINSLPIIKNRNELRRICNSIIINSEDKDEFDHKKKLKSYLIESNINKINSQSLNQFTIENTNDTSLKILKTKTKENKELIFYLDIEDNRFWKLHSLHDSRITEESIKKLVQKNGSNLDFVWMCSSLLEKYMTYGKNTGFGIKFKNQFVEKENDEVMKDVSMRFWGGGAKEVIDDLRNNPRLKQGINLSAIGLNHQIEDGFTKENISNSGRFTVMKGNSIDSHFNIVQKIKDDYSLTLNNIEEKYRIRFDKKECGFKQSGAPLYIDFKKPIENIDYFVDKIISSTNPFRLSGIKRKINNEFYRIFGIDLHTNDLVNLEITPNWISIYLSAKSCGNVVTRLLTNIQTHLTSQVELRGEDNERII